jgi:hypothetical protein
MFHGHIRAVVSIGRVQVDLDVVDARQLFALCPVVEGILRLGNVGQLAVLMIRILLRRRPGAGPEAEGGPRTSSSDSSVARTSRRRRANSGKQASTVCRSAKRTREGCRLSSAV